MGAKYILKYVAPLASAGDLVGISLRQVDPDDLFVWQALIEAPEDSIYAGGKYYLKIVFPVNTPFSPPTIYFLTPILHQSVLKDDYTSYGVCLRTFMHENWRPVHLLRNILEVIVQLLKDCNLEHPLSPTVSGLYHQDKSAYFAAIRQHVTTHAINNYERYSLVAGHTLPSQPQSRSTLAEICRRAIRSRFEPLTFWDIDERMKRLPIPRCMQEFLMTTNVDKMMRIEDPKLSNYAARFQARIDGEEQ